MKVLILDDERDRHEWFDKQYGGCEVWHAYNLKQFRAHLRRVGRFDIISFDHDIGLRETGLDAAKHLTSLGPQCFPDECVVHSWNPIGARRIAEYLADCGATVRIARFMTGTVDMV